MRMQLRKLSLVVEIIACFLFSRFRTVWFRLFLMMYIRGTKFPRIMFPFIYASLIIKKIVGWQSGVAKKLLVGVQFSLVYYKYLYQSIRSVHTKFCPTLIENR